MSNLSKIIRGLIKLEIKEIVWLEDSPDAIRAKSAYNGSLTKIIDFMDLYEKGKVSTEYIDSLVKKSEEK